MSFLVFTSILANLSVFSLNACVLYFFHENIRTVLCLFGKSNSGSVCYFLNFFRKVFIKPIQSVRTSIKRNLETAHTSNLSILSDNSKYNLNDDNSSQLGNGINKLLKYFLPQQQHNIKETKKYETTDMNKTKNSDCKSRKKRNRRKLRNK
jgi:hypothetical protein